MVKKPIYVIPTDWIWTASAMKMSQRQATGNTERYGLDDSTRVIIYLGRIAEEHRQGHQRRPIPQTSSKVMIVGGGPSLDDLKKQAEKEGVSDRVIFTGAVPPEEVPAYYQISEAFVSASTSETQGMTFIEALASGLPLFACPDEVLEDLIEETVSGFYFTSPRSLRKGRYGDGRCETGSMKRKRSHAVRYDMHTLRTM
ncbi:MAG: glycosyltransferase [Merdibacter sp.]